MSRVVTTAGPPSNSWGGAENQRQPSLNSATPFPFIENGLAASVAPDSWQASHFELNGSKPVDEPLLLPPGSPGHWLPELPSLLDNLDSLGSLFDDLPSSWDVPSGSGSNELDQCGMDFTAEKLQQLLKDAAHAENHLVSHASHAMNQQLQHQLGELALAHQALTARMPVPLSQSNVVLMPGDKSVDAAARWRRSLTGANRGPGEACGVGSRTAVKAKQFAELQKLLEQKQAEALLLEEQNKSLKRRQKMLDTLITVRDGQIQLWTQIAKARASAAPDDKFPVPWAHHPILGSLTMETMLGMTPEKATPFFRWKLETSVLM